MYSSNRLLSTLAAIFAVSFSALAQTPRVYLKFDGDTTDSSGAGIVTVAAAGGAPTYTTDRFGVANKALDCSAGSRSLQLVAASLPGNSNQALGLRNAGGTNTSFTLSAWIYCTNVNGGYNTVFGNALTNSAVTTEAGTLHAGLGSNIDKGHFGFNNGNDVTGAVAGIAGSVWHHVAFVYDTSASTSGSGAAPSQRIYINGIPEVTRYGVTDTLRATDLLIGNWGTATDASNDFRGRLDDVVVYNTALKPDQIQALFNGKPPDALPAAGTYSAPKLTDGAATPNLAGIQGAAGTWGVREIRTQNKTASSINGIGIGTLVNEDRIIRFFNPASPGVNSYFDYQIPVINLTDDGPPASEVGNAGYFPSNQSFWGSNTVGGGDNYILLIARCAVRIPVEDDYTFGFRGDDGSRLRVIGQQFKSSTRLASGNPADPAHNGDGLYYVSGTGDSNTLGVVHLKPGDYNLELTYWEGTGGSSVEVFAAQGAKTANDGTFQLVGDTANGGLELVRDPDTFPIIQTFTVNGGNTVLNGTSTLFVHPGSAGAPTNVTFGWQTNAIPTSLAINQGVGSVAIPTGAKTIAVPAATTTYTLTAQNGADVRTKAVTVYVSNPPIVSFTADDTTVTSGTPVTLSWVTDGAVSLTLNPGNIDVTGLTSKVVNPTADTTYTLVATNPSGTTSPTVLVQVGVGPTINSFAVTDASPLFNAETALSWNVSNSTSVSIDQGIGAVAASGTAAILPVQATTFTLSATNFFATVTAAVTVNVDTPIGVANDGINTHGFVCRRVNSNTSFPYPNLGYLGSALALLDEANTVPVGPHYSSEASGNYTSINFTDGADGDFTSGNVAFPGSSGDNFAMKVTATLVVNTPGEYTFFVSSDDGARLRIDGQDVIVDDSTHSPSSNSGKITLTKPTAQLELIYYDVTGAGELELGWIRPNLQWQLLSVITPAAAVVRGQLLISEFMADNKNTIVDEDGVASDWLEIWNSTGATINLNGYYLTDDATVPNKWALPAWTLGPNQYAVVFASQKDRRPAQAVPGQDNPGTLAQPHLHTNFKLSKAGGYLGLWQSNGGTGYNPISVFAGYPAQKQDVSYGSSDSEGYIGFMETSTPGQPNAATVQDFVKDTDFDHTRGRYSAAFNLGITTLTPGATIRYTTDGSEPTRTHGTIYTAPIPISATTVVRGVAYKQGWKATNVDTKTFLFINDVVTQNINTATALGFPAGPIAPRSQVLRYGMNLSNVTAVPGASVQDLKNALIAAPTICMTTDVSNLMNATSGIYANADRHGLFWERPVSLEYLNVAGTSEFQIDCGARIRGGYSRNPGNPKHAFHIYFRSNLYAGKLNYPLFGTSGASEFSQIDMRCEENYSWSFENNSQNSLMREEWSRVSERDMGEPYARTGYFHVYVNGLYWGIYNWEERTEAAFGETYLGGIKENVDTVKSSGSPAYNTEMTDGNFAAWEDLYKQAIALKNDLATAETTRTEKYMKMRGLNPDGTPNPGYKVLLDVDNLIDYILVIFYDGSFDAPLSTFFSNASNNWFGVRDRLGSRGFAFFAHDNEHGMDSVNDGRPYNRVGPWGSSGNNNWGQGEYNTRETQLYGFYSKSNPQYLHEMLAYSAEYRQRFADRVQKHLFNGGTLTTAGALARLNTLASQVDPIIHAEAARWGSTSLNKTSWLAAKNTITSFMSSGGLTQSTSTNFGAQSDGRTSLLLQQLQGYQDPISSAKPLASTVTAPTYSGVFGGNVTSPYTFTINNPNGSTGVIYYTVNGTDPRDTGGGINAGAMTGASPVSVTLLSTSSVRARIYNPGTLLWSGLVEAQYLVGTLGSASNLVISKIHYNPPGSTNLTQFVELLNIGPSTIDLTNVRFTLGIQFTFPNNYLLAAGGRVLIVRDMSAFTAAYGTGLNSQIAGIFANGTSLATGGARLQLLDAASAVIRDFTYDNKAPWPTTPDAGGPCLVLKRPETNPDHNLGTDWRASAFNGGSPGIADGQSYAAWAAANNVTDLLGTADDDGDGLPNLAEYFIGSNPKSSSAGSLPVAATQSLAVNGVTADYLTIPVRHTIGRDDAVPSAEAASDLATWNPAVLVAPPVINGDGTETFTYRYPQPMSGAGAQFLRMKVTRLP